MRSENLLQPAAWDEKERLWTWKYEDDDGSTQQFYYDKNQTIRFRVQTVSFTTTTATENGFAVTTTSTEKSAQQLQSMVKQEKNSESAGNVRQGSNGGISADSAGTLQSNGKAHGNGNGTPFPGGDARKSSDGISATSAPKIRSRSFSFDVESLRSAPPAMKILASCQDTGLGLVSWWG